MVEKLKTILEKFKTDQKQVWLFAFLKMDEVIDKWSLVISAPWINESNRNDQFEYILKTLRENLDQSDLLSIARVAILMKTDHLAEELLMKKSGDIIHDEQINGNMIHEGHIIESNSSLS